MMQDAILSALEPYGLKAAGPNKYRCKGAPWRNGSNSNALTLTIDPSAPGGGVYYDHVAKAGNDFEEMAQRLGIAPAVASAPKTTEREKAYAGLDDYAQAHGVDPAILRKAGWQDATWSRERIRALKYPTPHGDRYRLIDGGDTKYIQPAGYVACMYGLVRAVRLAAQTGQPLVLCNGEVSTIIAQHYGVAACAQNMGEKKLTAENLAALQAAYPAGDILITFDCDKTGRSAAADVYDQLVDAGYEVRALELNGHKGFDLANFATLHQDGTAAALLALHDLPPRQADASVYLREMERLRSENEQLRQELQVYRERDAWQTKILARPDIKLNEKAVLIGIGPILHMRRAMGSLQKDHTGAVPAAYKRLGEFAATSKSTVGRVIELGEKLDMWRRDPETKQTKDGFDIQVQRLELLPAFDDPALAQPIERKQHGGTRPNAGRKPKCPKHPTAAVKEEVTTVTTQYCAECGDILHHTTEQVTRTLVDEALDEIIQDETGEAQPQQAVAGNQDETGDVYNVSSVSSLPSVPPHIEEAVDLTTAIRAADQYSPSDELGRFAFKRALMLLHKHDADGAVAQLPGIEDPQAHAIVEHLAARHAGQAVTT